MANIAILGYGTVGSGVAEVIRVNQDIVSSKAGEPVNVKYILDLREFPGDVNEKKIVHDFNVILNDPEVSVVVETMGGLNPSYEFSKQALSAGKSMCTSNKELVAEHGLELMQIAREHGANYLFEASCGGAIPVIRPLNSALTADKLTGLAGIFNGTTNYILTKMTNEGRDFNDVLREAQEMGYAEKNPSADVDGWDTCRKLSILSSLAYGTHVSYEDIHTEGITRTEVADIRYAEALGMKLKLVGVSTRNPDGISAIVSPMMMPESSPLYAVDDVYNAIEVTGNMFDKVMFYGKGAGKLPTGSAVVSDVVDCIANAGKSIMHDIAPEGTVMVPKEEMKHGFFMRIEGSQDEKSGEIEAAFGRVVYVRAKDAEDEFGVLTGEMKEKEFNEKAAKVEGVIKFIRTYVEKEA